MAMKIMIVAGGTGGHIMPALATGELLRARLGSRVIVRFVSGSRAIERSVFESANEFPDLLACDTAPSLSISGARGLVKYVSTLAEARRLVSSFAPDAILAMGGYVCAPVLVAACLLSVPYYLHESNAVAGRVTRLFAGRARTVFLGCAEAAAALPRRAAVRIVGTPVRASLFGVSRTEARERLGIAQDSSVVFLLGGSQGARAINETMLEAIPELDRQFSGHAALEIVWSCGPMSFNTVRGELGRISSAHVRVRLHEYISDVAACYNAADLVISRAGASTLADISALGKPSILIPYPHAKDNHQAGNARSLASLGGAVVIGESDLTGALLAGTLRGILLSEQRGAEMSRAAARVSFPTAAETIAGVILGALGSELPPSAQPETVRQRIVA
ncbi:undecaprenyldiphospho-muramoylpentapeptide beta-N-acetylglucosaminyltransferase [Candidatus Poribacteria bacterium]|nr:undecaprenyldiphospho-muramoylpentapeptide beta-N-acetylglucosaminyltransferase [Candidatus Poribacteria bacterium]